MNSYNIASTLFGIAASQPDVLALALPKAPGKPLPASGPIPYHCVSFKEFAEETNRISLGLLASGFHPGERVVLMVPPSLEFFTLSFAFLQSGIIPVLIDPGIGIKNLKQCIREAEPAGFIGVTKAHVARVILGWGKTTIRRNVTIGKRLFWGGKLLSEIKYSAQDLSVFTCFDAKPDDLAAILFTSGSTGLPKGVMSTHQNMHHQLEIIRNTYNMLPGEVDMPTFAPFALFNLVAGMSSIIPDMDPTRPADVEPSRIIRAVEQFKVSSLFGSPALIDRVGRYGQANNIRLPTLKRVLSAGAPVSAKAQRRFVSMLNAETQIFTPYGATECLPVASIGSHEILSDEVQKKTGDGGGICIGKPVAGLQVNVIGITDEAIHCWSDALELGVGEIGEVVVKGDNVTQSYFNLEAATRLAKIKDGQRYWHRMGDLAYRDADGNLWFCGRKAHRVKIDGKEMYSVQCESIFNKHPDVYRTALVGARGKAVLCVEIDKDSVRPDPEKIKKELLSWAAGNKLTTDIQTLFFHPSFPVDIRHNAKIFREKLAVWAAAQMSNRNYC